MRNALCWIRRDLRLHDHTALAAATAQAERVAVVFVFDTTILDLLEDRDDRRVTFLYDSLAEVADGLRACGSTLLLRHGDPAIEIPKLATELGVEGVFAARDYEPTAVARDRTVGERIPLTLVKDHIVLEGSEVSATPYRVFTPYSRAWRAALDWERDAGEQTPDYTRLWPRGELAPHDRSVSLDDLGFVRSVPSATPGAQAGARLLASFADRVTDYGAARDFPSREGTSCLSPYLRFGCVSIRECLRMAGQPDGDEGREKWLSELIWREFYSSILQWFLHVVKEPFQPDYRELTWPGEASHFECWAAGQTGFPIVDAAMRCLNSTGWMHNRLRMVVASFLTKDLLIDYRLGEAYFARRLLDFDLASNNGGWQWAASTGCDAQPYFRIFNPILQSRKFDPEGDFLRRWLPELAGLDSQAIHAPWERGPLELAEAGVHLGETYPARIVDHAVQRERAIRLLAKAPQAGS